VVVELWHACYYLRRYSVFYLVVVFVEVLNQGEYGGPGSLSQSFLFSSPIRSNSFGLTMKTNEVASFQTFFFPCGCSPESQSSEFVDASTPNRNKTKSLSLSKEEEKTDKSRERTPTYRNTRPVESTREKKRRRT